jgi:NAD(P)-dependent dehydrogenase (short-subunit alcohol dehydrogenase family)
VSKRLEGKVVIVAGGGGIGDGCARFYAASGARVLLGDLDGGAAGRVAEEIVAAGGKAIGIRLDGADDTSIAEAIDLARSTYGGLHGFHANFACFLDGESQANAVRLPLDVYDEVMRVNARGFLLCTRHAVPAMIASGGGAMIYTSSGAAHMPETVRAAHAMSKAAGHALMRHVARTFGPEGIRANVIAPGVIRHARFDAVIDPALVVAMRKQIPVGRLGEAVDIAAMGALLLSDEGSFITGQVLSVDGGGSMRP